MTERRILVAIDGSEHSERAFDWYCENIRQDSDVLILAHTLELPPKPPTPFPYVEGYYENWKKEIELARSESKNMLAKYQYICEEKNIEILNSVHDERYSPGPSICKVADENKASLIILGSRGLGKVRRTWLGSISDYVVHHAHLPVCVVPPYDPPKNFLKEQKTPRKNARTRSPLPEVKSKSQAEESDALPTTTTDEGQEEKKDEGLEEKKDEGLEEKKDEGLEDEKKDEGLEEKKDEGLEEKKDEGLEDEKKDEALEEKKDEGLEEKKDEAQ